MTAPFAYTRVGNAGEAVAGLHGNAQARLLAGGTNLVDLMRIYVETPTIVFDVNHALPDKIEVASDGTVLVGALVRNSALAEHPVVRERYPMLS
jgi:xanthine dehydrogenase YagS FAD-binding subunit